MSEHTPGPWEICKYKTKVGDFRFITIIGDRQEETAERVALLDEGDVDNANLITAAPDLLAACKALNKAGVLTEYLGDEPEAIEAKRQARNAIAKAEGKEA
jgi:hypothetical protein